MFPTNRTKNINLVFSLPLLLALACIAEVRGQGSMREQARAIQQADLDRLLITAVPATINSDANRAAVMKQIREDFKDLQGLNNKMMAEAWARETLDYSFLSDMVSRIKERAARLKSNLNLPSLSETPNATVGSQSDPKTASDPKITSANEFRKALLVLDKTIMRFVTNPLFQTPNTLEVNLATKARQDLEAVISLTTDLKKTASRLRKTSDSQ